MFREIMIERGYPADADYKFWYVMQRKVGNRWINSPPEEWKPFLLRLEKTQHTRWMRLSRSRTLASISYLKVVLESED